MIQKSPEDLTQVPRFQMGEIVTVNGINFRISQISGGYLGLTTVEPEAQKWQAFGQGIVQQLNENGLLVPPRLTD